MLCAAALCAAPDAHRRELVALAQRVVGEALLQQLRSTAGQRAGHAPGREDVVDIHNRHVHAGLFLDARAGAGRHDGGPHESFAQNILEGWKFSWRNYEERVGLLVVSAGMFLLIPFTTLLPVFARDILQVGARGQGILLTCMGIGALFSSLLVAFLGDRMPRGLVMIGGVALYGVLLVLFAASSSFLWSMVLMFMVGLCHVTSHAPITKPPSRCRT